jgi:uroporphyrinogen decarboxylase
MQKKENEKAGSRALKADGCFLKACRREPTSYTPVWCMRQIGRYLPEYRKLREKISFLELCKGPDLITEATVFATERIGADAAIIFSDILLILEPMGRTLSFPEGEGPRIDPPVRAPADVEHLREFDVEPELPFVYESIRQTRRALPAQIPLIGFAGAPFTLAAYLIEGGRSTSFQQTKTFMYRHPGAWDALMTKLGAAVAAHLNAQISAGAQAVQIFDSWVGCLGPGDYRRFVQPHTRRLIGDIEDDTPVIHFGTGTASFLEEIRDTGASVVGLDFRVELGAAWDRLGKVAVQGNLDPCALLAGRKLIRSRVEAILRQADGRPGHIFNLGHGVLPETPVDNVVAMIDWVHEISRR